MLCPECGDPLDDGQTLCVFCWAMLVVMSEDERDPILEPAAAGPGPWEEE